MRRRAPRSDQPGNPPGSRFNETDGRHVGTRFLHSLFAYLFAVSVPNVQRAFCGT
jgi:hypothetical protein